MGASVVSKSGGGRRARRNNRRRQAMAEINVTPFVDVMLVLLIIFMVAAPLLTVGVPIELPKTAAAPLPTEQEEPLSITLAADGTVLIQSEEIAREELVAKLRAVVAERADGKLFLRADAVVPYGEIMEVMGALNAGGFTEIGLVTDSGGPSLDGGQ
ncbi:MAG: protein TolR [Pseudomonadota bacterium]